KDPQRAGRPGDQAAGGRSEQGDQNDRFAPDPVGEASENRGDHELGGRERGEQKADGRRTGAETLGVQREDRGDDAETDQVEGHGGPDGPVAAWKGVSPARSPSSHGQQVRIPVTARASRLSSGSTQR